MNLRSFLYGLTASCALLTSTSFFNLESASAQGLKSQTRPNFLFVLTDDQRKGAMGNDGNPLIKTPNLDRLAREGMAFRNAYVSTPVCSPSRGSILTGQYPHTHGVVKNSAYDALSHRLITFPQLLHNSGYYTAHIGKWHMGQDATERPGYDRWVCLRGQGEYFDPFLNIDGTETPTKGYVTDILTDYAVDFLKSSHGNKPFMLYLAHKAVHGPYTPPPRFAKEFADAKIIRSASAVPPGVPALPGDLEGKPAIKAGLAKAANQPNKGDFSPSDETIRKTLRSMMAVDESLGRILKTLEEIGQLDNTVVVFFSDNGYFWGEHSLGEKRLAYDESIGVPLLIRFPKRIKAGSTSDAFALNIDFAPTFLELANIPIPDNIQGRSLLPLLQGQTPAAWRQSFLTEFVPTNTEPYPAWKAVRTDQWKYIHYLGVNGQDELYDLKKDPHEIKNIINQPSARTGLTLMQAELKRLLDETSTQKPAVREDGASAISPKLQKRKTP